MLLPSTKSLSAKIRVWSVIFNLICVANLVEAQTDTSYDRDVRPILSDRCFQCHGPDTESREAGLRLDVADGDQGAHQHAIVPGSALDSEVWNRIMSNDESSVMPPPHAHKKPLSNSEKQIIKDWIDSGAEYQKFWAFQPLERPKIPELVSERSSSTEIDRFVLRKLKSHNLSFSKMANQRTLIRRVTFDLVGLPPTPEEIRAFETECEQQGSHQAWSRLVDRLLARSEFGEHMARYWLDLVRFADTNGMHKDFYRNNYEYRDWVIRAFNENLGYDEFLKFQLAGDLYDEPSEDQLIASGFHRLHLIIDRGTALPEESFFKNVIDRVTAVGTGYLGMTVHCAQCHDHKYDPISQKEFYSLFAFFNNIDAQPETVARPRRGLQQPFVSLGSKAQQKRLASMNKRLATVESQVNQLKSALAQRKKEPGDNSTEDSEKLIQLQRQVKKLRRSRDELDQSIGYAMVMKERKEIRPTHVLVRGQYDEPGEIVSRNTPAFLPPLKKKDAIATRMDLAEWFVQPDHPLTARVAVNRFWQQFFGVGLVKTSEDFGAQGEPPSHPDLLDFLAVEFVETGWDVKRLVRNIVLSDTYQQSSLATAERFQRDPENRLLSRGSRFRMDAEMVRDQILAASGLLNNKLYGPSVKPPQPEGLWKAVTMTGERFRPDQGDSIFRRSVYTYWKRAMPPPQMTILNAPNRDACVARRERTNTPAQALLLLNEPEYFKAARELARRTLQQPKERRIAFMWEVVTSKLPDTDEHSLIESLVVDLIANYQREPELMEKILSGAESLPEVPPQEFAAWTVVGNTLFNLDIVKTRE